LLQSAYYLIKPASASSIQMKVEKPTPQSDATIRLRYTFIRPGNEPRELEIPFVLTGTASRNSYAIRINSTPNAAHKNIILFSQDDNKKIAMNDLP
jgi:hypothetical protein